MKVAMTGCNYRQANKEDIKKLLESIKPKKMVVTSDEKVYEKLLETKPFGFEIKFDKVVNGTFVIDLEEMENFMKPPFISDSMEGLWKD